MQHEPLIKALYRVLLQREPATQEIAQWDEPLSSGRYAEVVSSFANCEEAKAIAGQKLSLFVPPGHYYSPIVDAEELRRSPPVQWVSKNGRIPAIDLGTTRMLELWKSCHSILQECPFPEHKSETFRYYFANPSYSYGDAVVLYMMIRKHQPRRIVEIGSGFSSACMLDVADHYLSAETSFTCIEPFPDLLLSLLRPQDHNRVRVLRKPVQGVEPAVFEDLQRNDILFIDSTHVAKTGSDVCHEFFNVIPYLNEGVLVHFHDIFYPFEYPEAWSIEENRSWNELFVLRAFLMYNESFEVIFFNDYFGQFFRSDIEQSCPTFLNNPGGGLWLRKRSAALRP